MSQLNRLTPCCVFILVSLTRLALCQSAEVTAAIEETSALKLQDLLVEAKKNPEDPLIRLKAIPMLQDAFNKASHAFARENIASTLMQLGQKDDVYWSILSKRAQEIVDSTAPDPVLYDANGKGIRGAYSPEFLEWVKTNKLSQNDAIYEHLGEFPVELEMMGDVGDPRGLPILRKGLSSPNCAVRSAAAQGLAVLQDKNSIPLIIEAARKAPLEMQWVIAQPLVAFDDPKARAAADELIPDKAILEDLKQRVKEKGPRGIW